MTTARSALSTAEQIRGGIDETVSIAPPTDIVVRFSRHGGGTQRIPAKRAQRERSRARKPTANGRHTARVCTRKLLESFEGGGIRMERVARWGQLFLGNNLVDGWGLWTGKLSSRVCQYLQRRATIWIHSMTGEASHLKNYPKMACQYLRRRGTTRDLVFTINLCRWG